MMMKKKVDAMKNPGLAKLPKKVRNNMGFMKDGGEVTANSISDRDRKFLQEMFSQKDKSKSANSISNRDVEFISKALKKKGFNKGGEVDYEYKDGGKVDLEEIADDIRETMRAMEIQEGIDSTSPEGEDAMFIKRKKAKTYMGGGMVEYGRGGRVSSGKGCGIATSGRKFSGTY